MILKTFFVSYLRDLPYAVIFLPIQNRFYPFIKAISDSNADSSYSILYSHVIARHWAHMSGMEWSLHSSVFQALIHTKFLSWVWPDGTTGHMLTHHQLCWHEFSRRSNKPMRTEPHYSMLATTNLVSTSLSGVGLISSTYSQNPSVSVTTMRTDPSRSLQLHACRCRASGMPSVSEAFQLMLPFAPPHFSKNLLW